MNKSLFFLFILVSCHSSNNNDQIVRNDNFQNIIRNYVELNPIILVKSTDQDLVYPQPSYHIFFDKLGEDTIMSIKSLPHYSNFNPINYENHGDSSFFHPEVNPSGYFLYKNKPIIIFDLNNYSDSFIDKRQLIEPIPEIFKFEIGKANAHLKSHTEYYKISNIKFSPIQWEEIHTKNKR